MLLHSVPWYNEDGGLACQGSNSHSQINSTNEVVHAYPILVFDVDISSFHDKAIHCEAMTIVSCNMQGSALIERKQQI